MKPNCPTGGGRSSRKLAETEGAIEAEEWRAVPGYEGIYEVSSLGALGSLDRVDRLGRQLKGREGLGYKDRDGYTLVVLCGPSGRAEEFLHRVVLFSFCGAPGIGQEALHGDGAPSNNRLSNLRWGTRAENMGDAKRHGTVRRGERSPASKITNDQALQVVALRRSGAKLASIGAMFGITATTVCGICRGRSRQSTAGVIDPIRIKASGERAGSAKLSIAKADEIRRLLRRGDITQARAGAIFGVDSSTVCRLMAGLRWVADAADGMR